MNTKIALESLSMDLKRVAMGYHRGSEIMAKRFSEEAIKLFFIPVLYYNFFQSNGPSGKT